MVSTACSIQRSPPFNMHSTPADARSVYHLLVSWCPRYFINIIFDTTFGIARLLHTPQHLAAAAFGGIR